MTSPLYLRLAWQTMRKNGKIYVPFLLGSTIMVMMLYAMDALNTASAGQSYFGSGEMNVILTFGFWIMSLFSVFFYAYLNGFLMQNRRQEYGLFSVLGLEKKHLIRILFYQTLMLAGASLLLGFAFGVLLYKLMFLFAARLLGGPVPLGYKIYPSAMLKAGAITLLEYLFIFLLGVWSLRSQNPIDLIRARQQAETEPKNRWLFALAGAVCLIAGYWIALSVKDPLEALFLFFGAVALVIVGTYLMFIWGSISLLKLLEKNKSYYYQTRHFINTSNMKYRMKQNAVSLANICILSTMILVAISTTVSLQAGIRSEAQAMFPRTWSVAITTGKENIMQVISRLKKDMQGHASDGQFLVYGGWSALYQESQENENTAVISISGEDITESNASEYMIFYPIVASLSPGIEANYDLQWTDGKTMKNDGVYLLSDNPENYEDLEEIAIGNKTYPVSGVGTGNIPGLVRYDYIECLEVIFPDLESLPDTLSNMQVVYFYNPVLPDGSPDPNPEETLDNILQYWDDSLYSSYEVSSKAKDQSIMQSFYSSLLFIGIFISILILTIIVLIMYYKQISEGYQDKDRYRILKNAGLEPREVKNIINQQALWMFFLPLIAALIHVLFAYPMISRMLSVLISNTKNVFLIVMAACVLIFALIYLIIYKLTARIYYSIVARN